MIIFRKSTGADLEQMVQIAEDAKTLLKSKGVAQWQRGLYPHRAIFAQDVLDGYGYVLAQGKEVLAICAVTFGEEPAYRCLIKGHWLSSTEAYYATIHRAAVARQHQGKNLSGTLFQAVAELARTAGAVSVRVDTHPDNLTMQKALLRAGFQYCGELRLLSGDEAGDLRLGFEQLL